MRRLMTLPFLLWAAAVNADMLVVVGKNSPLQSLNENEVSNIFLAKTNYLKSVGRVTPLELVQERNRSEFYIKISGKNPAQINSYWTTLIFTGKGKPPKVINSLEDLLKELTSNPGAVAYLPNDQLTSQLRVVYTVR